MVSSNVVFLQLVLAALVVFTVFSSLYEWITLKRFTPTQITIKRMEQRITELEGELEAVKSSSRTHFSSYHHSNKTMYGHVHIGKTGGTSLNGILANKFERICGNKGYSYDAFQANERAKEEAARNNSTSIQINRTDGHDRVGRSIPDEIGFEDCDYVSKEARHTFFIERFGNNKFYGLSMELHIPCRDPLEHLMSTFNHKNNNLNCTSEEDLYMSLESYKWRVDHRYSHELKEHFPNRVKCYDFRKQFTSYIEYMSKRLQPRRLVSEPYIKRETNKPRNRTNECIWDRPDLQELAKKYLLSKFEYYQFCNSCMGSEDEITKGYI